ncbi:MAG TPA: translation initiation factor IF-3 [Planctomycetia bacterium]|nr:translation initiation factor IF-3 [Planctomycetia bacterium]
MSFDRSQPPPKPGQPGAVRINDQIRISPLRVIDADGTVLGIIPREKAMELAKQQELDLVEVAAGERPPVCKIMDYGRFKFEQNKKVRKQKHSQLKEVRFRPGCGEADLLTKLNHAREFLAEKHKVLFVCQLKGRENIYGDDALRVIEKVIEQLGELGKVEKRPAREGRRITAVVAPR